MPNAIPGLNATGQLSPGLSAATVRSTLGVLSSSEIAAAFAPINHAHAWGSITGTLSSQTDLQNALNAKLSANQTITVSGDATGSGSTAITLTLANSGVGAGTYKSVTVDAKGRVTGGTNPTTLAGYGITDGGDALTTSPLSQFAATSSAQLAGVISDETGSGALVFAISPTLVTPNIGAATGTSLVVNSSNMLTATGGTLTIGNSGGTDVGNLKTGIITTQVAASTTQLVIDPSQYMRWIVGGTQRTEYGYYGVRLFDTANIIWSNGSTTVTADTSVSRLSTGVVQIGSGSSSNALGSLACTNVTASGNLGVGGTPSWKMHFQQSSSTVTKTGDIGSEVVLENPIVASAGPMTGIRFVTPVSSLTGKASGRVLSGFSGNTYTLSFITLQTVSGSNTFVDALTLQNGSVAVGQGTAAVKLDVAGSPATGTVGTEDMFQLVRATNPGVSWPQAARFSLGRYSTSGITTPRSRLDIKLADTNTGATPEVTVMTLQGNGAVLVGTTTDDGSSKLQVNGNLASSGVAKFTGYPTALLPAAASNAGAITYDTTIAKHVGCNGSTWNALW